VGENRCVPSGEGLCLVYVQRKPIFFCEIILIVILEYHIDAFYMKQIGAISFSWWIKT
jgi:hypothetical protein